MASSGVCAIFASEQLFSLSNGFRDHGPPGLDLLGIGLSLQRLRHTKMSDGVFIAIAENAFPMNILSQQISVETACFIELAAKHVV